MSIEYGPLGVTSNVIAPGPIAQTEVCHSTLLASSACILTSEKGLERLLPTDAFENYVKSQPLGRLGAVRDIADATVYLFADSGSYVTGQVLVGEL